MFSVIIVEDDESMQNQIRELVRKVTFNSDIEVNIHCFKKYCSDFKQIMNDVSTQKLYILDIELGSTMSGIKIANLIREEKEFNEKSKADGNKQQFKKPCMGRYVR